jgi:hypothetical protein
MSQGSTTAMTTIRLCHARWFAGPACPLGSTRDRSDEDRSTQGALPCSQRPSEPRASAAFIPGCIPQSSRLGL